MSKGPSEPPWAGKNQNRRTHNSVPDDISETCVRGGKLPRRRMRGHHGIPIIIMYIGGPHTHIVTV